MIHTKLVVFCSLFCAASVHAQTVNPYERLLDPVALTQLDNSDFGPIKLTSGMGFGIRPDTDNPGYFVYAEDTGSGILTHLFATARTPDSVTRFRLYIDGALRREATLDGLFSERVGLLRQPLDTIIGEARLCDVQIPFKRGFKISYKTDDRFTFYNYGWRSLPANIQFPDSASLTALQAQAEAVFLDPSKRGIELGADTSMRALLYPGDSLTLTLSGPSMIEPLKLSVDHYDGSLDSVWLFVYWDDEVEPSIAAPLMAVFGQNPRFPSIESIALQFSKADGLILHLPMPFARSARFVIVNSSSSTLQSSLAIRHRSRPDIEGRGYLHAVFAETKRTLYGVAHHVFRSKGKGRFVGLLMGVRNLRRLQSYEGDAIFTIDDNPAYSFRYEGTEDYFNGAQYFSHGAFEHPFGGAPDPDGSYYRFHYLDAIDYERSIVFDFQHGTHDNAHEDYVTLPFWYERHIPYSIENDTLFESEALLRVHGGSYTPGVTIDVRIDSAVVGDVNASPGGRFDTNLRLTGILAGRHTISINGVELPGGLQILSKRTLQLAERRALPIQVGDTLQIYGLGYTVDEHAAVLVNNAAAQYHYEVDSLNRLRGFIVVPKLEAGVYPVAINGIQLQEPLNIAISGTLRFEAEDLVPDSSFHNVSYLYSDSWSQNAIYLYSPRRMGDSTTLHFQLPYQGRFRATLYAPHGRTFGNYLITLDSNQAVYMGFADKDVLGPDSIDLGLAYLEQGPHRLRVQYLGKSEASTDSAIWIDYVELRAADTQSRPSDSVASRIAVWPNPATSTITIVNRPTGSSVRLIDVLGRTTIISPVGPAIQVGFLPRGAYWVIVDGHVINRIVLY